MSKGLELPTNTLIILIIAIIVLLAVAALFMGGWIGVGEMTREQALNAGCHKWLISGCADNEFLLIYVDKNRRSDDGDETRFRDIADEAGYDIGDTTDLKHRCGCVV